MSKLLAKDEKESLNVKKMSERTEKVIFSTLAEFLVDGEITIDEKAWPKKEDVISLKHCCKSAKLTGYKIEMSLVSFWHKLTC
jgi:hypothetical protein